MDYEKAKKNGMQISENEKDEIKKSKTTKVNKNRKVDFVYRDMSRDIIEKVKAVDRSYLSSKDLLGEILKFCKLPYI